VKSRGDLFRSVVARCQADYIDVYTQVREPFQNLLNVPLHGRYCGLDIDRLPKRLVSMTNILVIGFFSDSSDQMTGRGGFRIAYQFIDDRKTLKLLYSFFMLFRPSNL